MQQRRRAGQGGETERPAAGVERNRPRTPAGDERSRKRRRDAGQGRRDNERAAAAATAASLPAGEAQRTGQSSGVGPARRLEVERAIDRSQEGTGQIRPHRLETRRSRLDRLGSLQQRALPERVASRECFPEHHPDRPDVRRFGRDGAREPLRGDVGERPRDVSLSRQRLRLLDLREAEVQDEG